MPSLEPFVDVHEQRFLVGRKRISIDVIAVVLACNIAIGGANELHRLVMAAMNIFGLISSGARRLSRGHPSCLSEDKSSLATDPHSSGR